MKLKFKDTEPNISIIDDYECESCIAEWSIEFQTSERKIEDTIIKVTSLDMVVRDIEKDWPEDTENIDILIVNNAEGVVIGIDYIEVDILHQEATVYFY